MFPFGCLTQRLLGLIKSQTFLSSHFIKSPPNQNHKEIVSVCLFWFQQNFTTKFKTAFQQHCSVNEDPTKNFCNSLFLFFLHCSIEVFFFLWSRQMSSCVDIWLQGKMQQSRRQISPDSSRFHLYNLESQLQIWSRLFTYRKAAQDLCKSPRLTSECLFFHCIIITSMAWLFTGSPFIFTQNRFIQILCMCFHSNSTRSKNVNKTESTFINGILNICNSNS